MIFDTFHQSVLEATGGFDPIPITLMVWHIITERLDQRLITAHGTEMFTIDWLLISEEVHVSLVLYDVIH